jgi:hypothetical protein
MSSDEFDISTDRYIMSELVRKTSWFWKWLGDIETQQLSDDLETCEPESPIYISGLARSGSTVLLRMLSSLDQTVSHQYRDFPFLYTPYWWNQVTEQSIKGELEPAERAHKDRIKVTPRSPESREETLWMHFFDSLHDPSESQHLESSTNNESFENFYRDHLRKILLIRGGSRYLSKANYNLTRIQYLETLFPEPKFIIPIRHPVSHIASSQKQHELFNETAKKNAKTINYLKHVGHFEFGPHRTPINAGDDHAIESVLKCWDAGESVKGWAKYWSHLYEYVADRLVDTTDSGGRESCLLVRYETYCRETEQTVRRIGEFLDLEDHETERLAESYSDRISEPNYYNSSFSTEQERLIWDEVEHTANRFDYEPRRD